MIFSAILWYLITALVGWLAVPLAYRLLPFLPDRGLTFTRPLGLLLTTWVYWLLVSLHVLQNDAGGIFFALLALAGFSALSWRGRWPGGFWRWLRAQRRLVITSELLFLALFIFWTVVRAANPDISSTEKPMELAFINAILRSPVFPPADPWLSGYGISYYYFGYVMVAMLARLAGVTGSVAFNLALATWFALTGLAAYGLLYNLLAARARSPLATVARPVPVPVPDSAAPLLTAPLLTAPLLAPLFVLIVSNLEGFLEILHSAGVFWTRGADGLQSTFWKWLNILEINTPPAEPFGWTPARPGGIWWWRASRVLQDLDWARNPREIIDEFPAFSYILGDLHPHVLSMPFVMLAVALAFNMFLKLRAGPVQRFSLLAWLRSPNFWLTAVVLGGLSFLNTWDFPIYLALFAAAVILPRVLAHGWSLDALGEMLILLVLLGLAGVMLYLPFYLGFDSQAGGLVPSLIYFTRGAHFWVMFGSLLLPIFAWLTWKWRRGSRHDLLRGVMFAAALVVGLWLLSSLFAGLRLRADPTLAGTFGAPQGAPLVLESLVRRLQSPGAWLSLFGLLALTWGLLRFGSSPAVEDSMTPDLTDVEVIAQESRRGEDHHADSFVLLLLILGAGLVLFPEFFYLRDQFGTRMNTIFKFYFQAWIVLGMSAAYASAVLFTRLRSAGARAAFFAGWAVLILMALVYPAFGISERARNFVPERWTLDGSDAIGLYAPDELEALRWLQTAPYGVVAEASSMRASYTGFARVSTLTGLPTVLGWPGHEMQWRGGAEEIGTREPDLQQLYSARTWPQIREIIQKYQIRYIYVGGLELSEYRTSTALFEQNLKPVFQRPSVTIYEAPNFDSQQVQADNP